MLSLSRVWLRGLLKAAGLGGFVALLLLSTRFPDWAPPFRWLALAWLLGFGAAKCVVDLQRD